VSDRLGPLVHRSVHHAAILWVVGAVQFVLGMAVTQWAWDYYRTPPTPVYSLTNNYISDFGAVHCAVFHQGYVCSPWHDVFNVSIVLLGIFLILGVLLIPTAFPRRSSSRLGLALLALAGIGAIGVGLSPEDVNLTVHMVSALLAFAGGALALIVLGFAMFRDTRWDGFRVYSMLSGLVSLVALVLFVAKTYGPLGVGGMERLIVAPILLWSIVVGIHLLRVPTFAPPGLPKPTGP
jgi:hypothetical membrane protein